MFNLNDFNSQTKIANAILKNNAGIDELQFLENQIETFLNSKQRDDMYQAYQYFKGEHDILKRKRGVWKDNDTFVESQRLPNNKIVDNQYKKVVEQKTNYLFARKLTIESEDKDFENKIKSLFDKKFTRMFKHLGENAINYGIAWLYVYLENGFLKFKNFAPYEILPFWADEEQTVLDLLVRVYQIEYFDANNNNKDFITKVEIYRKDRVDYYTYDAHLTLENSQKYFETENQLDIYFENIPVVFFKGNNLMQPLLNSVKSLQDSLNLVKSNFVNYIEEDPRTTYLVVKGYDAESIDDFKKNFVEYGMAFLDPQDTGAGIDTLQIAVSSENYTSIINMLKKSIFENANAFDVKDERLANNPNQMNIRSMYSDIDLSSNGLEVEFQFSLEILFKFCALYWNLTENTNFSKNVEVTFNKDQLLNASELIQDLANSYDMLSKETILSNHPFVKDVQMELERLEKQEQQMYRDAYPSHEV